MLIEKGQEPDQAQDPHQAIGLTSLPFRKCLVFGQGSVFQASLLEFLTFPQISEFLQGGPTETERVCA